MLLGREPVAYIAAVGALIALLVGFGLPVTPAQVGLIMAAVQAGLSLLARANVSPVSLEPVRSPSVLAVSTDPKTGQAVAEDVPLPAVVSVPATPGPATVADLATGLKRLT